MTDAEAPKPGRCPTCNARVSKQRLGAMLRRLYLPRLLDAGVTSQAELIKRLRSLDFAASQPTVSKDLARIRALEAQWAAVKAITHPEE